MDIILKVNKDLKSASKNQIKLSEEKDIYYKKTINPLWASFFIISYTAITVLGTSFLLSQSEPDKNYEKDLTEIRNELLNEIRKTKEPVIVNSGGSKIELEKLRGELIDEVNRMNLKYLDIIEKNKKQYTTVIEAVSTRQPASLDTGKKVLPYNAVNEEVLVFKHQKLYNREKEKLKNKEKDKIAKLDLSNSLGIEKMKAIQDETEIALFELKKRLYYKRQNFRKDKYIVMNE